MATLAQAAWTQVLDAPAILVMFIVTIVGIFALLSVILVQWRRVRIAEAEASVKLRMVENGYSAQDIERILQASLSHGAGPAKPERMVARACC